MLEEQDRLVMLLKRKPVSEVFELFHARFDPLIFQTRTFEEECIAQEQYVKFLAEHGWTRAEYSAAIRRERAHQRALGNL